MIVLSQSYIIICEEFSLLSPILVTLISNSEFTYEDMFKVATRQTSAFGIEGYEAPKKYADPLQ